MVSVAKKWNLLWHSRGRKGIQSSGIQQLRPEKVNRRAESIHYLLGRCQLHAEYTWQFCKNGFAAWKLVPVCFRSVYPNPMLVFSFHSYCLLTLNLIILVYILDGVIFSSGWKNPESLGETQRPALIMMLMEATMKLQLEEQSPCSHDRSGWSLSKLDFFHCFEDYVTYHCLAQFVCSLEFWLLFRVTIKNWITQFLMHVHFHAMKFLEKLKVSDLFKVHFEFSEQKQT